MKKVYDCEIIKHKEIAPCIFMMEVLSEEIVCSALAGQFVSIYLNKGEMLLPRPISICDIDKDKGTLKLIYGVVGKGTAELAAFKTGEVLKVLGPVGNGFKIEDTIKKHIVIGGGIGTPPLIELVKQLKGKVEVFLGFAKDSILEERFKELGATVYVATEDGSMGIKGNVIDLLEQINPDGDMIYSCGPKGMLRAVDLWGREKGIKTQVSLEERMACGIGACVGCTCKTKKKNEEDWQNRRVCKDGPVFWGEEVVW
ncbi:MAG: dihydroorotate dehydrogenase electron transfer subunit [Clostridiaceae bacterium]|nr:dihydroorotate dehydrogenase electron transfer subunit [Clostridiaceae bacterium]